LFSHSGRFRKDLTRSDHIQSISSYTHIFFTFVYKKIMIFFKKKLDKASYGIK